MDLYQTAEDMFRNIYNSRIHAPPILDLATNFPNGEKFIKSWQPIRDEALKLAENLHLVPRFHEILPSQSSISANDPHNWRLFVLKAYGFNMENNMAACPVLASTIAACPDVTSAAISFLDPGKHIPPHHGPFKGVLRFYLVLSMPKTAEGKPAAVLKIDGIEHALNDGECLLWDDTFEHEAWNHSNEVRAVLLLDVWRRNMPLDMQILSKTIIGLAGLTAKIHGIPHLSK